MPTNKKDKVEMKNKLYPQVVGSLIYMMLYTRLDISCVMSLLSRF